MARFFIDVDDGERQVRDEAGIELARADDAAHETEHLLLTLGQAEMLKGRPRTFRAVVRDAVGRTIYRATATLEIELFERRRR